MRVKIKGIVELKDNEVIVGDTELCLFSPILEKQRVKRGFKFKFLLKTKELYIQEAAPPDKYPIQFLAGKDKKMGKEQKVLYTLFTDYLRIGTRALMLKAAVARSFPVDTDAMIEFDVSDNSLTAQVLKEIAERK